MSDEKPLVNADYLLEKYPGKGGWTYAVIPEIPQNKKNPFGWVRVNGRLFLPVRAEIRKKIGKQAGDYVKVVLYADDSRLEIPQEILECFENEPPKLFETFSGLTEGEQKAYLDWIYGTKNPDTKAERIAKMMERLQRS